jgi:hypothetical protein
VWDEPGVTTLSRREVLAAGVGSAVMASGVARASAADPQLNLPNTRAAYEPWYSWRSDAPKSAAAVVHAAVLAANAHDTQPWKFRIDSDRIDIYADTQRHLGAMDPFRREMHLSLGCALENAALVARSMGYAANIEIAGGSLRDEAGARVSHRVASIGLTAQRAEVSALVAAIPHRHTNRSPYQGERRIADETLGELTAMASDSAVRLIWITDAVARRDFASATVAATQAIVADPVMIGDSDHWFRATDAEIERYRDGPTLYCAGLSPWVLLGARLMPPPSAQSTHRHWIDQTREAQLGSNPVIGLISVKDLYDPSQALRAGRLWQRLHLQGTLLGLGMQPLNQLPECVDRELQLGKPASFDKTLAAFGDDAWRATFAFRVGWPTRPAAASPRRALQAVIMPPSRADS